MQHNGSFSIVKWEEEVAEKLPEPLKFSRGRVERAHKGVLEGTEVMHYGFIYSQEARSEFSGIGVFEGTLLGVSGRFAMIERGTYAEGVVHTKFEIRALSETSDLGEPLGTGKYSTGEHVDVGYVFETES